MDNNGHSEIIESQVAETVEITRALKSKQPRIKNSTSNVEFNSVLNWLTTSINNEVAYGSVDNRERDKWLATVWQKEPHLAGVLNGAVLIDANRGWTFVGGRNQVNRYINIMHDIENGQGYRQYIRQQALAYRTSDLGAINEIGREGRNGPMRTLWFTDPSRCRLTGDDKFPLGYKPEVGGDGKEQAWTANDYFRIVSMPSTRENMMGLGFCGVSRCIELTKIMMGILRLDQEKLVAKMPEGMLFLEGITEEQWDNAMKSHMQSLSQKEREVFGGVFTFASMSAIKTAFVSLANYPDQFDRLIFTNLLMYGYALELGYSPDEFWPVQYGALGRGNETEMQHRKAVGKGGQDFTVMFQEQLQDELPPTLLFQFDERDIEGEIEDASLRSAQVDAIRKMYDSVGQMEGLISREEARSLLAEMNLIPPEWTEIEEEVTATDEEPEVRARMHRSLQTDQVQRAAWLFQEEPIIEYHWPTERVRTIVSSGKGLLKRRTYSPPLKRNKRRADNDVLYQGDDFEITESDVDAAIKEADERVGADFAEMLRAKEYE